MDVASSASDYDVIHIVFRSLLYKCRCVSVSVCFAFVSESSCHKSPFTGRCQCLDKFCATNIVHIFNSHHLRIHCYFCISLHLPQQVYEDFFLCSICILSSH